MSKEITPYNIDNSMIVGQYKDFKLGARYSIVAPPGCEVIVESSVGGFIRIPENENREVKEVARIWTVKKSIVGIPWAVIEVSYIDSRNSQPAEFGANGEYSYKVLASDEIVKIFPNQEQVSIDNIKDYLKPHINPAIEKVLSARLSEYGIDMIDKLKCQEEIKGLLSSLFLTNYLALSSFTITRIIGYPNNIEGDGYAEGT